MNSTIYRHILWITLALLLLLLIYWVVPIGSTPFDPALVEMSKTSDGIEYRLLKDGRLFRVDNTWGRWHYIDTVFFPEKMRDAYKKVDGVVFRFDEESGLQLPVRRNFTEGFEDLELGVRGTRQLIGEVRGWGSLTLQSPKAREVRDYVALRTKILQHNGSFLDASVMPDDVHVHSGSRSLRCVAPPKPSDMITCKSSVSSPLVYFVNGDDFWYQAFYYAEDSLPFTILDLECEWIKQHAGIRVRINEQSQMEAELKALDKPTFRQKDSAIVLFPMNRWVKVTVHFRLSHREDGIVQLWQDDQLVVDSAGVTLPWSEAVYSSLEVGISAHSYGTEVCKLWIDDIMVADHPFFGEPKGDP
jgi:hypothetical protein